MPLKPSDGAGAYVKDFRKSKAPQFKGKSDKKKQQMAIAAYLDDKDEQKESMMYEKTDQSTDRLKMLVRLGMMDRKDMTKIVRALDKMKEDKPVPPAERKVLFSLLNELIGMITGDDAMFMKAKKAVREDVDPEDTDEAEETNMVQTTNESTGTEITVGGYTTKHFHMCGSAIKTMKKHSTVKNAEQMTRLQDQFLKMEMGVMNAGEATDEQKSMARSLYNKIIGLAKSADIEKEVNGYMKMHLDSVIKGKPKPGFGRVDQKESRSISFKHFAQIGGNI